MSEAMKKIDWTKPIEWLVEDAARLAVVGRNPNNPDLMIIAAGERAICVDDYGRESDLISFNVPPVIRNAPEEKLRPLTVDEFLAAGIAHCRHHITHEVYPIHIDGNEVMIGRRHPGGTVIWRELLEVEWDELLRDYEFYWPNRGWGPAGIEVTE